MAATDRKKVVWGKGGDFGDWSSDGCSSDLGDAGGQRQRAVAGCRGSHGRAAEEKAATDGGRWRLHHARQYREDGRARDRFSGKHGEDNEWGDGATAASAECLRLSVGEESLSLSGGQMAAIPRAA